MKIRKVSHGIETWSSSSFNYPRFRCIRRVFVDREIFNGTRARVYVCVLAAIHRTFKRFSGSLKRQVSVRIVHRIAFPRTRDALTYVCTDAVAGIERFLAPRLLADLPIFVRRQLSGRA